MLDMNRADLTVGIIGAGAMGRGIAQVAAAGGISVRLFDSKASAAAEAVAFIERMLGRSVERGRLSADEAKATVARITVADGLDAVASCHVVIEAIVEDLAAKRALFKELDRIAAADAILATNTSSLSVTAIAAATTRPERVGGLHFFNPVPLMRLVEAIGGIRTERAVVEALLAVGRRMGKHAVEVGDTPGFLVNHAGRAYGPEALRILGEGIAEPVVIDRIMREGAGFRMGPLELLDLTGLDVSHPVMEEIYGQYYHEPMYRPSVIGRVRAAGGLLGRKTGAGFYVYEGDKQSVPPETMPADRPKDAIWVSRADAAGHAAVTELLAALGATVDGGRKPKASSICVVTPLADDCTTAAIAEGLDPGRTVAVDTLFGLDRRRTVMATPITDRGIVAAVQGLLSSDGKPASVINDSPGFVAPRVVALIVNIACNMAQQRVARPADIDTAVKLGLNYPFGPLEWGDALGSARVLAILAGLFTFYGDPRYRPSPWLKRRAALGVSLLTPDP